MHPTSRGPSEKKHHWRNPRRPLSCICTDSTLSSLAGTPGGGRLRGTRLAHHLSRLPPQCPRLLGSQGHACLTRQVRRSAASCGGLQPAARQGYRKLSKLGPFNKAVTLMRLLVQLWDPTNAKLQGKFQFFNIIILYFLHSVQYSFITQACSCVFDKSMIEFG